MSDPVATTLRTWALDAQYGEPVEVSEAVLNSAADHIDYLCGANLSLDTENGQLRQRVADLQRQIANTQLRRTA